MKRVARQGYLLIICLLVLTGLTALTTVSITRSTTELLATNRFRDGAGAFYQAEAGLDCAISQLHTTSDLVAVKTACDIPGKRTMTLQQNLPTLPIAITSQATTASITSSITAVVSRTITSPFQQAVYAVDTDPTPHNTVHVGEGCLVDSYNSALGSYGATLGSSDPNYGTLNKSQDARPASQHADLYTNSTATGTGTNAAIMIAGWVDLPAQVKGSTYTPTGSSVYVEPATGSMTGTIGQRETQVFAVPVPPSGPPASCTPLGSGLQGGDVQPLVTTSYPETCYYANSLTVTGGVQATFPNLQTLYVYGNITINGGSTMAVGQGTIRTAQLEVAGANSLFTSTGSGGAADGVVDLYADLLLVDHAGVVTSTPPTGAQNLPRRIRIYSAATGRAVLMAYGGKVYGTIYAPNGSVELQALLRQASSGEVYGSVLAKNAILHSSAQLHYDEALTTVTGWPSWTRANVQVLAQGTHLTLPPPPPPPPVCGDGMCNGGSETPTSCPIDCLLQ